MEQERLTAVREHLRGLVESPVFSRAPNQARALAAMVEAACDAREQSGADLAQAVYGRADESYVRAVRQLARELRLKLPLAYEAGRHYPVRFELHPHHYAVRIVTNGAAPIVVEATAAEDTPTGSVREPRRAVRFGLAILVAIGAFGALGALAWKGHGPGRLSAPTRIEIDGDHVTFFDAAARPIPGWREHLEKVSGFQFRGTSESWPVQNWVQAALLDAPPHGVPRLAAVTCDPFVAGRCAVHLLAADGGKELGRFELPRLPNAVSTSARLHEVDGETFVPDWTPFSVAPADLDGDGIHDEVVLAVRLGRLFPAEIVALDFDGSWTLLADYWNMGTARALALPDLDGDGRDEILVYGENNSYQRAVVTLLPSAAGFPVGARSPDGYRLARLAEVEHYPYAGITFQFPITDLGHADSERHLRNVAHSVDWDRRDGALVVGVQDAIFNPLTRETWHLTFRLEAGTTASRADIVEYDAALTTLKKLIADESVEDRWNIRSTQRLSDYGRDLASRIQVWDAREPNSSWRPIRNGELSRVFPRAGASVTASAR